MSSFVSKDTKKKQEMYTLTFRETPCIIRWSISCFWAALVCGYMGVKIPSILARPPGLPSSGVWNLKCPKPQPSILLMTCPISHQCCSWCCCGCWCAGWVGVTFSYIINESVFLNIYSYLPISVQDPMMLTDDIDKVSGYQRNIWYHLISNWYPSC